MTNLYEKNQLTFSIVWIVAYVVLASLADSVSQTLGMEKLLTVPVLLAMCAVLYLWISRWGLKEFFGLCMFRGSWREYLYFAPLAVLVTVNLWNGVKMNFSVAETLLYIASMLLAGFLEELIFRGLLFKAMLPSGVKSAFTISALTFGIGHIVNLLNGADFLPTLLQILYAMAIGLLFTLIFYRSGSLLPCILTHSLFNAMSAFAVERDSTGRILICLVLCLIPGAYSLWLLRRTGAVQKDRE